MIDMKSARIRRYLLGSTALLALPGVAQAQTGKIDPVGVQREAQSETQADLGAPTNIYLEAQGQNLAQVTPTPEIVIANPNTPTTARDPNNITGIGQMVVDSGGGSVGLCTATLINPRVVIFAAHCVNSRNAAAYGANSGGTPIAFGFETYTRANAAGQPDELLNWYNGGSTGPGKNKTNIAQAFYNSNWVSYNTLSLEPAAQSFLYGDVALASLDTPAANIPTWALLFSPLTNTSAIGASGTGYNVGLVGYGGLGTGEAGQTAGSDFRRRAADNMIGALTDLETFESFLFGGAPNGLKQNLYFIDFDDPRRGMATASPFDFNAFRDNARGAGTSNPTEGVTAPGDSGGPLILQNTFAKQVVIGVLSGGYSRFFNGQPSYSYGAVSFYQPLYLYWDWIAANNPYHYVGSVAGNGAWTDPTHWVSTLDPAYLIQSGTTLVNGLPTLTGQQKDGTSGDFGQICFQQGGSSDCYDTRTGVETYDPSGHPIGTAENQPGEAAVAEAAAGAGVNRDGFLADVKPEAQAAATTPPAATLANGLPGATNFVPNNSDPVRTGSTISTPRYFDVTLAATGTTTLSGANVTIDRLTIGTSGAQLVIDQGASLTSLMNVNQLAGFNTVNGTLTSTGDYSLMGGGLLGTGRINAPFLTSVLGQIAPGTTSTIGTLTIGGNLVLSSGSNLFVNLGNNATSDLLAVVANGTATGTANVGGTVTFAPVAGSTVRANDTFTILTAAGGRTGTFTTPTSISAILTPTLIYNTNSVQVRLTASSFSSALGTLSAEQAAYASLLDRNRGQGVSSIQPLYDYLDLQDAATIRATLTGLAPQQETTVRAVGTVSLDNINRVFNGRLASMDSGDSFDGSVAMVGSPLQVIAMNQSGALTAGAAVATQSDTTAIAPGKLPDGVRGFIAGGYLDSSSRSAATGLGGRDKSDGFYVSGGIEARIDDSSSLGFALSYSNLKGDTSALAQRVKGELFAGTLYAKTVTDSGIVLDGQFTGGVFQVRTRRAAVVGPTTYNLSSRDNALAVAAEAGIGKWFGEGIKFGPRAAFRTSFIGYTPTAETGGAPALRFDRGEQSSAQGLLGLQLGGATDGFRPFASAYAVHEFLDKPAAFGANFVNGVGANSLFALAGHDRTWGELSAGLTFGSGRTSFSLAADTTVFRKDVSNQSYRGSISFKF